MDVVVTVPMKVWDEWIREGDLPGQRWSGIEYAFSISGCPDIQPGERVYIVAHGKLRGYAPLIRKQTLNRSRTFPRTILIRGGGAVACTVDEKIPGFRGYKYRWWEYEIERQFPNWFEPKPCEECERLSIEFGCEPGLPPFPLPPSDDLPRATCKQFLEGDA